MATEREPALRRFVYEMQATPEADPEGVWNGQLREVREADESAATAEVCTWWVVAHGGVRFRIVGERISVGRGTRFLPFVADDKIPEVITRLERVIGLHDVDQKVA